MTSTFRRECMRWLKDSLEENRETLGYRPAPAKVNGADQTFLVHEGLTTVNIYYFDLPVPRETLHEIISRNAQQEIAVMFVCEESIMPRGKHEDLVQRYDDFHAILQTLTDGRVHLWDGKSVYEVHYERVITGSPVIPAYMRKFYRGSTIDLSGLQILDITHGGDILPEHAIGVRFSNARFWECKEEPKYSGFNPGGYTDWNDFFSQNFHEYWQHRQEEAFFHRNHQRTNTGNQPPHQNRSGRRDDYTILGISPTATADEVQRAWKKLLVKHHPDKNPDNVTEATKRTQEINAAFERLCRAKGIK